MPGNKFNNDKLNIIDNSSNIIPYEKLSIFPNNKKQFSENINKNNFNNINENNKKSLKSNYLNIEPNYENNTYSLNNDKNKNKILSSSSSYNNILSQKKFITIDNEVEINNKKSNQLNDYEIIGNYKLYLNKNFSEANNTYYGINIKTKEEVAIKTELTSTEEPLLELQKNIYEHFKGGNGIPKLYWYGTHKHYNVLIRELLGDYLQDYLISCNNKFTLLTTLMLAEKMISLIEFIHSRNYIHRNIKPAQFLMGRGLKKTKYISLHFVVLKCI